MSDEPSSSNPSIATEGEPTPLPALPEKLADKGTALAVRLVGSGEGRVADGEVRIQHWDDAARTTRALVRLAVFWFLAVATIAIPMLHFCLVPGLFVVGPIAAWLAYRQRSAVLGGVGRCPHCTEPVVIDKHPDEWPMQARCDACGTWSSVERRDAEAPDAVSDPE